MSDPQQLATRVAEALFRADAATRSLGATIEFVAPGQARLAMTVQSHMLNGHGVCHGGYITTLADSAFAYACNSRNAATVAAGLAIEFVAPGRPGDRLVAAAREVSLHGRTGHYDVMVHNQEGTLIALMRGRSHQLSNQQVIAPEEL